MTKLPDGVNNRQNSFRFGMGIGLRWLKSIATDS